MARYFAYGSNMETVQMTLRVPEASVLGRGRLAGWSFACNKIGRDGSAKANVRRAPGDAVWGVVFDLPEPELRRLDRFEGGYRRELVSVELADGDRRVCEIYVSDRISTKLLPRRAYRDRMVRGARAHGLPEDHVRALEGLEVAD